MQKITISQTVNAPIEKVWQYWTEPEHIMQWNAASDDWHCPSATNDLREGGRFTSRMEAKDGSAGFDFAGTYTQVVPHQTIVYKMDDDRAVVTTFKQTDSGVEITTEFDAEETNPIEMQRAGWQAILDRFKNHVEA